MTADKLSVPSEAVAPLEPAPLAPVKKHGLMNPIVADVIGIISSLAVTGITAWQLVSERAYKNLSSLQFFEAIKEERRQVGEEIAQQLRSNVINKKEAHQKLNKAIKHFADEAEALLEKADYGSFTQKFKALRHHQKVEVLTTCFAYGGIALGSVLLLTRGVFSKQQQDDINRKSDSSQMLP